MGYKKMSELKIGDLLWSPSEHLSQYRVTAVSLDGDSLKIGLDGFQDRSIRCGKEESSHQFVKSSMKYRLFTTREEATGELLYRLRAEVKAADESMSRLIRTIRT